MRVCARDRNNRIKFAAVISLFAFGIQLRSPAEVPDVSCSSNSEVSSVSAGKLFGETFVNSISVRKEPDKFISNNSEYMVYASPKKSRDIKGINLKNRSLSLSIPIEYRKNGTGVLLTEEKKVIKHLNSEH